MTKEQKAKVIADAVARLQNVSGLYLADFAGLTVEKANQLRSEFFKAGVDYKVIKNTLFERALKEVGGYDGLFPYLVGQTGVVFAYDDPVAPARLLKNFVKDNEKMLSVKACVIGTEVFDGARLEELASLPTREEIIAGIVGSIAAPAQGIVGAIHGVMSGIVYALDAIEKQKAA
ncbi:MAG: 50S ribosomal protein L10 [Bacteroidota bacterium]|jgi:large subunit ribosomal protein L10|nr:50S ribosomal protein L10 [Bacteroidota bacterium]